MSPDELPTTYEELAQPEWKGRMCLRNSSNTYTQSLVASLIGNLGYDEALTVVDGWAANAEILPNDVIALNSMADDLCDVAIVNHYYLARLLEEDPDFRWVWSGPTRTTGAPRQHLRRRRDPVRRRPGTGPATAGVARYRRAERVRRRKQRVPGQPRCGAGIADRIEFGETFVNDDLNAAEFGALNADAVRLLDEAGYE